jgi:hypothetical protein
MDLVSREDRNKEQRGQKIALIGESGVGKTTQLFSLPPEKTLFIDLEAGDLAVDEWEGVCIRPKTWEECTDIAVLVGGINPALAKIKTQYSKVHFDHCIKKYKKLYERIQDLEYLFVDSLTHTGRLSFQETSNTPEGMKDARKAYGTHGQNMIKWLTQLQQARHMHVIFLSILNKKMDDNGGRYYDMQIEGSKTGEELPGIVDELITMTVMDEFTPNPYRAFVCKKLNRWGYPAKDRAGKLDEVERPHLGELIEKLKRPRSQKLFDTLNFDLPAPTAIANAENNPPEKEQV